MARGGRRAGAGRKPGSPTRRRQEIALKAAAEGMSPLEVLLGTMRAAWDAGDNDLAARVVKDAAPYIHPRLAAIEHTGEGGGPVNVALDVTTMDRLELARWIALKLKEAVPEP